MSAKEDEAGDHHSFPISASDLSLNPLMLTDDDSQHVLFRKDGKFKVLLVLSLFQIVFSQTSL